MIMGAWKPQIETSDSAKPSRSLLSALIGLVSHKKTLWFLVLFPFIFYGLMPGTHWTQLICLYVSGFFFWRKGTWWVTTKLTGLRSKSP